MNTQINVYAENAFAYDGIKLYFMSRDMDSRKVSAAQMIFSEHDESNEMLPAITLRREESQVLMDALWQCGIRPTEGMGSAGALAATQDHLRSIKSMADRLLTLVEVVTFNVNNDGGKQ